MLHPFSTSGLRVFAPTFAVCEPARPTSARLATLPGRRPVPSSRWARRAVDASSMPRMEDAPPLYKPELIEPKKRLTILQRCYKEPWVPIGQHAVLSNLRLPPSAPARCSQTGVPCPWQAA